MTSNVLPCLLFRPASFSHEISSWVWGNLWDGCVVGEAFTAMAMLSRWSASARDSSLGSTAHAWQETRRTSGGFGITHGCSPWSSKPEWRERKSPTPSISMSPGPSARYRLLVGPWVACVSMFTIFWVTFIFIPTKRKCYCFEILYYLKWFLYTCYQFLIVLFLT